jgi:hypothetical protein
LSSESFRTRSEFRIAEERTTEGSTMKTTFLSATAISLALAVPAFAAPATARFHGPCRRDADGAGGPGLAAGEPPGTTEQVASAGDAGTANRRPAPAPGADRDGADAEHDAGQPTDPTKANESTGMRAGDPGSRQLPSTPGSGPQTGTDATTGTAGGSVMAPGATSPGVPKASEGTGMRTGDPGAREQPTNPRPRG